MQRAAAEGRPVFYANVELTVDGWAEFDPLNVESERSAGSYHEYRYSGVPDGALLLIDEARFVFSQNQKGKDLPHVLLLTTHRHAGYDIYIVTQHPVDLPAEVRRRVEDHVHLKRRSKKNGAQLFRWRDGEIGDIVNGRVKNANRGSISAYRYKKEVWNAYKSSTIHNVKSESWPWYVWAFPVVLLIMAGFAWAASDRLANMGGDFVEDADSGVASLGPASVNGNGTAGPDLSPEGLALARATDGLVYLNERRPAVAGVVDSAPIYREKLTVESVPRLQCVLFGHKQLPELRQVANEIERFPVGGVCRCYSQQASLLDVPESLCRDVVRRGYFEPALPDTGLQLAGDSPAERPGAEPDDYQRAGDRASDMAASVTVVPDNSAMERIDVGRAESRLQRIRQISESIEK